VEELEEENAKLKAENTQLKEEITTLKPSQVHSNISMMKTEFIHMLQMKMMAGEIDMNSVTEVLKERTKVMNTNTMIEFTNTFNKAIDGILPMSAKWFLAYSLNKDGFFQALDFC